MTAFLHACILKCFSTGIKSFKNCPDWSNEAKRVFLWVKIKSTQFCGTKHSVILPLSVIVLTQLLSCLFLRSVSYLSTHNKQQKTETEYFTNKQGKVNIKLDVPGDYLVNAVHITEGAFNRGELWTSYWASLTFQIP